MRELFCSYCYKTLFKVFLLLYEFPRKDLEIGALQVSSYNVKWEQLLCSDIHE
jgi:hypothetical protein